MDSESFAKKRDKLLAEFKEQVLSNSSKSKEYDEIIIEFLEECNKAFGQLDKVIAVSQNIKTDFSQN